MSVDKASRIDALLNEANARKKAKQGRDAQGRFVPQGQGAKQKPSAEEKAQAKEARRLEREEKRKERDASRKPAHMAKVEKARARLPQLGPEALAIFNSATVSLPANELAALSEHIVHFNRAQATKRALEQALAIGDRVRIVSGRHAGSEGTVTKSQRIRCYVQVEGSDRKPVYLFTSEVELLSRVEPAKATG